MIFVGYLLLCYLIADFVAGFFHWLEDQYFTEDMPIIGKIIAGPNSMHHAKPTAFLNGTYLYRNWTTFIVTIIGGVPISYFFPCSIPVFLFVSQANEIHGWSHQKCNDFIRAIQETELLASVRHHAQHHVDPFSRKYCVMSGWLNPVLDYVRFWAYLEYFLELTLKIKPKHYYFIEQIKKKV